MSKKICFWCDNVVEKDGELCLSCRERKIKGDKELEQIDKEYNKLFGHLDCKGMIKLYKERSKTIADLEAKLAESEEELKQYKYAYENSMVLDYTSRNWLAVGSIQQENELLKQQLAEVEKALELACKRIVETGKNKCEVCSMNQDACAGYKPMCSKYIKSHFIYKSKQLTHQHEDKGE